MPGFFIWSNGWIDLDAYPAMITWNEKDKEVG